MGLQPARQVVAFLVRHGAGGLQLLAGVGHRQELCLREQQRTDVGEEEVRIVERASQRFVVQTVPPRSPAAAQGG
jgi:hypothetical protein